MFTLPGLLETKLGSLPYVSLKCEIKLFHRFVCDSIAVPGYMSASDAFVGTSMA